MRIIGERGSHIGQFIYPFDVATNYNCEIVVSDGRNRRVQLFSPNGDFIKVFGPETYETPMWKHTLDTPRGVCFTPSGNILVTDFNNHRIVELDNQMNLLRFIGSHGRGSNRALKKFHRPQVILNYYSLLTGSLVIANKKTPGTKSFHMFSNVIKL